MKRAILLAVLLGSPCAITAYSQSAPQRFNAGAIFQPGMTTIQNARDTCSTGDGSQFGACFVQQLQAAGASPQAVAFMHANQDNGYMHDFRNTGRVDIAFAFDPLAANENEHCLLVNGSPALVDVDDYQLIQGAGLAKNAAYAALLQKFPNIAVFPGNRTGTAFIVARNLPTGGQRFVVPYVLVNGCHACARVGAMKLAFDFDPAGKFLGVRVASVQPLSQPPSGQ